MSTASPTVTRPGSPADVVVLQYANPTRPVTVPIGILLAVVVVMIAVTSAIVRSGGDAADIDFNGAILWSITGFVVSLGVQGVAVTFPFALALGSTRRTFVLGTLVTIVAQAASIAAASVALLGVELATGGWFVGARVLSDSTLGAGDPLRLAAVMFLTMLTALAVGGVFGASWVRFGAKGPLALGIAIALIVAAALLVLLPAIAAAAASYQPWWPVAGAVALIVMSTLGEYALLRRASVR
jgi:hypothetical protein